MFGLILVIRKSQEYDALHLIDKLKNIASKFQGEFFNTTEDEY